MTNTETSDIDATVDQILRLEEAGCDIVRCTANSEAAARAFEKLKERTHVPLVADIHFNHKMAILAMEAGADKIRINPGNIGSAENLRARYTSLAGKFSDFYDAITKYAKFLDNTAVAYESADKKIEERANELLNKDYTA
jgi:4-hydroxy-3-methylbut-2-en-1-yl diphosphate synthase IspG/GcpE